MSVIQGGAPIVGGNVMPTTGPRTLHWNGVPPNGVAGTGAYAGNAQDGDLCVDVLTGNVYENQEVVVGTAAWVRIDTI